VDDNWAEVATLEHPDDSADRKDELALALDVWLAERGCSRDMLTDEDLRLDLLYLGPGRGCMTRLLVNVNALPPAP
jgi:hypothetical protein